jgi:hypothetical protein
MEYDPDNLTLLEELRETQYRSDREIVRDRMQEGLTKLNKDLQLDAMEFVVTHRNATSYYKHNGRIYGCYMCKDWHIESRNADTWISKNVPTAKISRCM